MRDVTLREVLARTVKPPKHIRNMRDYLVQGNTVLIGFSVALGMVLGTLEGIAFYVTFAVGILVLLGGAMALATTQSEVIEELVRKGEWP